MLRGVGTRLTGRRGDAMTIPPPSTGLRIREVSQILGVPAPTLRSWERRYGVPVSTRSSGGHRRYLPAELQQMRLMRDEIARGLRASEAARAVRHLLAGTGAARRRVTDLLDASESRDPAALRIVLDEARVELGLATTIDQVVMPGLRQVGAWWASGRCGVDQEHITTETIRGWLARLTTLSQIDTYEPPILLACGPRDQHSVGLEALAALLAEQGRGARLMGPRTSEHTLVSAVTSTGAAGVVVVSHLRAQRRPAVDALRAVADTGTTTFYAGNAFSFPEQRAGVPGTYLGETLLIAATTVIEQVRSRQPAPRRPRRAA